MRKLLIITILSPFLAAGQSSFSPYSFEGVGNLSRENFSRSHGMGGISSGLRSFQYINHRNPASYTSQDTNSFILDFGLSGYYTKLQTATSSAYTDDMSLNTIVIAFPLTRWWKSSVGVLPYSSVGYSVKETHTLAFGDGSSTDVNYYYRGVGGLNRFFWGNAFQLTPNLSIGINSSYFFGFINREESLEPVDQSVFSTSIERRVNVSDFSFAFGAQYENTFLEKWNYTLGATYQHQKKLSARESYAGIVSSNFGYEDTLDHYQDERVHVGLPSSLRVGFSLGMENIFLVGMDYEFHSWGQVEDNANYENSQFVSLGLEYIPNALAFTGYLNRIRYRVGGRMGNSNLKYGDHHLSDQSFTVGLGFPFRYSHNTINISYEVGARGTTEHNLIKEQYQFFWINLTFQDVWFIKPKFR